MNRKDQIESLFNRYIELNDKLYIGHDLQTDVYDEREGILKQMEDVSLDRINFIFSVFDSLPKGEWCKPNKSSPFGNDTFEALRWYRELLKPVPLIVSWAKKESVGYHFCIGEDDGYPETATLAIPIDWLTEEDDDVRYQMIFAASNLATLEFMNLDARRSEAKNVLHLLSDLLLEEDAKRCSVTTTSLSAK